MKKIYIKCFILALAAILLELFVFNFRTWESMTFDPVDTFTMTDSNGRPLENGQTLTFSKADEAAICLEQINATAHNLYIDIALAQAPSQELQIQLFARDEGNAQYYSLPKVSISRQDPGSRYIKLDLSGQAKSLKITLTGYTSGTINIHDIGINRFRPLDFSFLRLAAVYIVLLIICAIRPGSRLYAIAYSIKDQRQKIFIIALLFAELAAAVSITLSNKTYCDPPWIHHYQYHELAVSMSKGHFYLDIEPSQALMDMENPYDTNDRNAQNVDSQWDTAYYDGKYYCYFGVLPVIIYYLPYYLLTGEAFPTFVGILINSAAIIAGVFFLLHMIVKTYFRHASIGLFALLQVLLTLGSGLLLIVNPPTFYNMPVSMGLALTLFGLYFWLRAAGNDGQSIRRRFLCLGAVCMALVAPCRPQMLVGSFLIFPILWKPFKKTLGDSKKTAAGHLLAAAVPYIIVAAMLMYYNYARFGSPFDFGANYNLTTNDMTHRGFHLDRLPLGLFMYLIQPPAFTGRAPFMTPVAFSTSYQGTTILETMYGGFLWFNLITLALLFYRNVRSSLKQKKLAGFCCLCVCLALIVVCADVQMAGILQRYGCDFGLFFTLPAVIIVLAVHEKLLLRRQARAYGSEIATKCSKVPQPAADGTADTAVSAGSAGNTVPVTKYPPRISGAENVFYKLLMWVFLLTGLINILWLIVK